MTRTFGATTGGLVGWCVGYTLPVFMHLRRPFYDPIARAWLFTEHAGPLPMGYLGQVMFAILGTLLGAGLLWILPPTSARAKQLWTAWSLTALVFSLAYFTWHNLPN